MTPFLFELKNRYTQYQLYEVLVFKGKYSIRLYEIIRSFILQDDLRDGKEKEIDFTVEELKKLLCCESYKRWVDFDRYVLQKAVEEINCTSDIMKVSYDTYKKGKVITKINFIISCPTLYEKFVAHEERRKRLK